MSSIQITHIGGPTALIEIGGWRLLTDPTFDPPGGRYYFGWGATSRKQVGPAIAAGDLPPVDAILLSHDHHGDNLDPTGRALLPSAGVVVTTVAGAKRLGGAARGLAAWQSTRLEAPGRPAIEITATPCRHGPPGSRVIVGDVIGFALAWDGQEHGVLWISGDTVLYDGVREVARLQVDTALLHLGGVRFPVTGPLRYTMTAREAVELCGLIRPRTVIPIHYEGWKHFRQGRARSSGSSRARRRSSAGAFAGCRSAFARRPDRPAASRRGGCRSSAAAHRVLDRVVHVGVVDEAVEPAGTGTAGGDRRVGAGVAVRGPVREHLELGALDGERAVLARDLLAGLVLVVGVLDRQAAGLVIALDHDQRAGVPPGEVDRQLHGLRRTPRRT